MYKNVLRSIDNIDIFPVIGLAIFMGFFCAWLFYVWTMKKDHVEKMGNMPLEDGTTN